jgi:hypothetical protein
MLAFGQKACEPRFRLLPGVRAGHADDVKTLLPRDPNERALDGGGFLWKSRFWKSRF